MELLMLFIRNLPSTFRESFIWFLMTYSFPVIQILVIWGIRQEQFTVSIDILNIILVTNASLYTAILLVTSIEHKKKPDITFIDIVLLCCDYCVFCNFYG